MKINPRVFREYDIRGVADVDFTDEVVLVLGQAIAKYYRDLDKRNISIGYDCRESSKRLFKALTKGFLKNGCNILDIGVVPTPLLYFSIMKHNLDAGVMITASHNPPQDNGFKLSFGRLSVFGEGIQKIYKMIEENNYKISDSKGMLRTSKEVIKDYIDFMKKQAFDFRGRKIVIDSGNGTAGLLAPKLFRELGAEVIELFSEPDGTFPNHPADPTVAENLKELREEVLKNKADIGFGYDGDADRMGIIDDEGNMWVGDEMLLVFSEEVLMENPGAVIVADVKSSSTVFNTIKSRGGEPLMWKTGHSNIKDKMKDTNAILGGEMSSHMFFADRYFGYDDGIYASLRFLQLLRDRKASDLYKSLPRLVSTPEIRVPCSDDKKFEVVEKMKDEFKDYEVIDIDGIRVKFDEDSWGLVRASNTQPVLVLRFEANTESRLKEIKTHIEEKLNKILKEV